MLGLPELLVLGAASYRGTQLLVHDSILDGPRKRLELWHAARFDNRVRTFFRDLLACTYCTGWWLSLITVLTYLAVTDWDHNILTLGLDVFAVAGVQALLNRWDDNLGSGH